MDSDTYCQNLRPANFDRKAVALLYSLFMLFLPFIAASFFLLSLLF